MQRRKFLTAISTPVVLQACGGGGASGEVYDQTAQDASLKQDILGVVTVDKWYGLNKSSAVYKENLKAGTSGWALVKSAQNQQVQAFCTPSINKGNNVDIYASIIGGDKNCKIEIYRIGWYGGLGARLISTFKGVQVFDQSANVLPADSRGLTRCQWVKTITVSTTGIDWTGTISGYYLIKLTASSGFQSYCYFVMRQDEVKSDYCMLSSTATAQAYNTWGGKSLYAQNDATGHIAVQAAHAVTYDRPYAYTLNSYGAGNIFAWEVKMIRFAERLGLDITYMADIDCHTRTPVAKVLMMIGHCEYWTYEMRQRFIAAQNSNSNLFVSGANTGYWQIRLEPGILFQDIVCYKLDYKMDPQYGSIRTTSTFATQNMPEEQVVGVSISNMTAPTTKADLNLKTTSCPSWLLSNLVYNGVVLKFPGLLGYEMDKVTAKSPSNIVKVSEDILVNSKGITITSNMVYYQTVKGAKVFNTSSMHWNYGLDSTGFAPFGNIESDNAKQLTLNALNWLKT